MTSNNFVNRLNGILREITADMVKAGNGRYLTVCPDPDDICIWYVLVQVWRSEHAKKQGSPCLNLETILKLTFKGVDGDKFSPPRLNSLTPNGVYEMNGNICLGIGEFHSQNFPIGAGPMYFINYATALFLDKENHSIHGMSINIQSDAKMAEFAANSKEYNRLHHKELMEAFYDQQRVYLILRLKILNKELGSKSEASTEIRELVASIPESGEMEVYEDKVNDLENKYRGVKGTSQAEAASSQAEAASSQADEGADADEDEDEDAPAAAPPPAAAPRGRRNNRRNNARTPNARAAEFPVGYQMRSETDEKMYRVIQTANGVMRWVPV